VVGGDFARFAKSAADSLDVSVPAGNHWGKTGIMSREQLFSVSKDMEENPLRIKLILDPDKTTGFCLALSEAKDADVWRQSNVWFHSGRNSRTETFAYLVNTQNGGESYGDVKGPGDMPEVVTLTIKPGYMRVETDTGMVKEGKFAWLKPGVSAYFYLFSHPKASGEAAAYALKSVKIYR
jgi:hypothetical protein